MFPHLSGVLSTHPGSAAVGETDRLQLCAPRRLQRARAHQSAPALSAPVGSEHPSAFGCCAPGQGPSASPPHRLGRLCGQVQVRAGRDGSAFRLPF